MKLTRQEETKNKGFPLIGQLANARTVVSKEKMISHAKKFAMLIRKVTPEAGDLDINRVWALCAKVRGQRLGKTRHTSDCDSMDGKAFVECHHPIRGRCMG